MTVNVSDLIRRLEARDTPDFHRDRQLSDEVLLATGWTCEPDGARVRWSFGTNPRYCAWEPHHPHPIQDLNTAVGAVPFDCTWSLHFAGPVSHALVRGPGRVTMATGKGAEPAIALCVVAVKAWQIRHADVAERLLDSPVAEIYP